MLLAGELGSGEVRPDWKAIADTDRPVTLVLRIPERFGDEMNGEALGALAVELAEGFATLTESAQAAKVQIAGVQIDFDCPTSKLGRYGQFLAAFRGEQPHVTLSITALPTWLSSSNFKSAAQNTDYFVLQVHALEAPATADGPLQLCDVSKLDTYLREASAIGVPYYVALPTYGYRIAFNPEGEFAGLTAEGPAPVWPSEYTVRELRADPVEMAAVARDIQTKPPAHCLGLTWFRLPVKEDALNWSWPTLHAVMQGHAPTSTIRAELRTPEPGLTEVWLSQKGDSGDPVRVSVNLSRARVAAWDVLNGFESTREGGSVMTLTGRPQSNGTPMMIAWFRQNSEEQSISILTHTMEKQQ